MKTKANSERLKDMERLTKAKKRTKEEELGMQIKDCDEKLI